MWLSGLELWQRFNSTPWHGGAELQWPVEGSAKLAPSCSHLEKRDLVTIEHLRTLCLHLDLTNSLDIAVFAVACMVFLVLLQVHLECLLVHHCICADSVNSW